MAELFRVGGDKLAAHTGNSEKAVRPNRHGARIGLAGFRNDPNGMLVMVDVGGLEPGNYNVGIGDPSVSIGQPVSDVGNSDGSNPALPAPNPGENAPFQPQGSNQPADIPKSVLAEVAPNTAGVTAPATGQVNPITAPATGAVNPTNTTATGQSTVTNQEPQQQLNEQNGRPAGPPGINDIGTLTVDQSGTGRMQHVVEGIRVQNVVGQALIISSFATPRAKTLPPNLDATADPASRKPAERADVSAPSTANGTIPAAAGIIRLISDRGPGPGAGEQQGVPAGRNAPASQRTPAPVGLQQ
jgi:hypothetical protein